jgi:hypothetical protein
MPELVPTICTFMLSVLLDSVNFKNILLQILLSEYGAPLRAVRARCGLRSIQAERIRRGGHFSATSGRICSRCIKIFTGDFFLSAIRNIDYMYQKD